MCKSLLELIDEAIEQKEILLECYKKDNDRLLAENARLKKENEELKLKKDW